MRALLSSLVVLVVASSACSAATPPPERVVPPPPRAAIEACWIELGRSSGPGFLATSGWSTTAELDGTVSVLLVRHGDRVLLIDAGNSAGFDEHIAHLPLVPRMYMDALPGAVVVERTLPEALAAAGVDVSKLSVLITHAHSDHMGGLVDLPGVPVWMAARELRFVLAERERAGIQVLPAHAAAVLDRARPFEFVRAPYEIFARSVDLFGDGTVVVVPLGGHTPGSVGVFVNVSPTQRLFHVGDAVLVREGYERGAGKSFATRFLDDDHAEANKVVRRLQALHAAAPDVKILPAHDRTAWADAFGGAPACLERQPR